METHLKFLHRFPVPKFAGRPLQNLHLLPREVKVLLDFFQKIADSKGRFSPAGSVGALLCATGTRYPLVAARRRRNSFAAGRIFGGELPNIPVECLARGPLLQEKRGPALFLLPTCLCFPNGKIRTGKCFYSPLCETPPGISCHSSRLPARLVPYCVPLAHGTSVRGFFWLPP